MHILDWSLLAWLSSPYAPRIGQQVMKVIAQQGITTGVRTPTKNGDETHGAWAKIPP